MPVTSDLDFLCFTAPYSLPEPFSDAVVQNPAGAPGFAFNFEFDMALMDNMLNDPDMALAMGFNPATDWPYVGAYNPHLASPAAQPTSSSSSTPFDPSSTSMPFDPSLFYPPIPTSAPAPAMSDADAELLAALQAFSASWTVEPQPETPSDLISFDGTTQPPTPITQPATPADTTLGAVGDNPKPGLIAPPRAVLPHWLAENYAHAGEQLTEAETQAIADLFTCPTDADSQLFL
jgi:hypothetical protein